MPYNEHFILRKQNSVTLFYNLGTVFSNFDRQKVMHEAEAAIIADRET